MLNNNNHNSSCTFAGQIVSYLYDEASVKEKTEFVAHLENCSGCSDELTAFGFVRSSIQEWRNEEIFALEMPALEIPNFQTAEIAEKSTIPVKSDSWIDGLRRLFSLSPKLAFGSAAFAALIVCAGLALVILNSSNGGEIASNSNKDSKNEIIPNIDKITEDVTSNPNPEPKKAEFVSPKAKPEQAQINSPKNPVVKASGNSNGSLKNKNIQQPNNSVAENKRTKTIDVQKQEAPKLSNLDEDEDKSLRLADLFAEIGTK